MLLRLKLSQTFQQKYNEKQDNLISIYSSVPNRRAVRNKRTGGKILKKNIKRAGQNRRAGRKIFLQNIKRAGRNRRAGGKFM